MQGTIVWIRKRALLVLLFLPLVLIAVSIAAFSQTQEAAIPPFAERSPQDEIVGLRTESSKSYRNPDGSITAVISLGPVHYKDEQGSWQDIDLNLSTSAKSGCAFSVTKSPVHAHFAESANGWQCVEFDGHSISFAAQGASTSVGVVNGPTVTYPDAWPGVDLKYTVLPTGVKEELIIKQKPTLDEFPFALRADSLQPMPRDDGSLEFTDSSDKPLAVLPAAFAVDAAAALRSDIPVGSRAQLDGSHIIFVPLDPDWLAKATYPVIVDPTICCHPGVANDDGYYTGTWHCSETYVMFNDGVKGCFRFDISGLSSTVAVTNTLVTLRSYGPPYYNNFYVNLKQTTSNNWPVAGVAPVVGSTLVSHLWIGSSYYENLFSSASLTSLVQQWVAWPSYSNNNCGLALVAQSDDQGAFCSHEYTYSPTLQVTYQDDSTYPTVTSVTASSQYCQPGQQIDYAWSATDSETPITQVKAILALSAPGQNDWDSLTATDLGPAPIPTRTGGGTLTAPDPSGDCGTYYVYLQAKSGYGWSATATSDEIIVDGEAPTVTITSPPADELHIASDGVTCTLKGMAYDDCSGVDTLANHSIQINTGSGFVDVDSYDPQTCIWQYDLSSVHAQSYTIQAKAKDNAGNWGYSSSRTITVSLVPGGVVYVSPTGVDDANHGGSWAQPYLTLQYAIDAADLLNPKAELWVAEGTYNPPDYSCISMAAGVSMYGGFVSGATYRENRDWLAHPAVIDVLGQSLITPDSTSLPTTLDGFTITGGGTGIDVSCYAGTTPLTIRHNTVRGNTTAISVLYTSLSVPLRIVDNWITGNSVNGIDLYSFDDGLTESQAVIANNTISSNAAAGIRLHYGAPTIANNIIAFNGCGFYVDNDDEPTFAYNCVHGNGENNDYYNFTPGAATYNIDDDPITSEGHIDPYSPCRHAGVSGLNGVVCVATGDTDIGNETWTPDLSGHVDIGADQANDCLWYHVNVEVAPEWIVGGNPADVTATVTLGNNQNAGSGHYVTVTTDRGVFANSQTTYSAYTDANGEISAQLTVPLPEDPCRVTTTVTGTVDVNPWERGVESSHTLEVFCRQWVDIVFCLDCTGSMWSNGHSAEPSVEAFLDDMFNDHGVTVRAGCVRFNDGDNDAPDYNEHIRDEQKLSMSAFTNQAGFEDWLDVSYMPYGGATDIQELQLDALYHAAQDMTAHAISPHQYIVLITDGPFHDGEGGSLVTLTQVASVLPCPVYISHWVSGLQAPYQPLLNGGEFDPANQYDYPLTNLRDRILTDLQLQ